MALVHAWRNVRKKLNKSWTYEEVEKELHQRDQEEEDNKRDPEQPQR